MRTIIPIIICGIILSLAAIIPSYATTMGKQVVCLNDPTYCPNANVTVSIPILASGYTSTMHFGDCANNQILKYQSSNSTWICATDNTGGGLTSINSDTTAAQLLSGETGNITATTSSGTTTFKLGTNIPVLGGSAQAFTKKINFTSTSTLAPINLGTLTSSPTSPRKGDFWLVNAQIKYNDNSNTTEIPVLEGNTETITGAKTFSTNPVTHTAIADPAAGAGKFWYSSTTANVFKYSNATSIFTIAVQPKINFTNPTAPGTETTWTGHMSNLLATITPYSTGRVEITISGFTSHNTINGACDTDIRIGSTLIASQGALGNTKLGVSLNGTSPTVNAKVPFSITVQATGLAIGTKEFIQIGKQVGGVLGTCTWANINVAVKEL
jgi:hypothetical protein